MNISLKAEQIFHLGGFPITNTLLLAGAIGFLMMSSGVFFSWRRWKLLPGRIQNFIELVIESMLQLMDSVLGDRRKSEKYLPLIATLFIFILFSNWFGLLPGIGSIGLKEKSGFEPFFRSPASDLNFTLSLAIITVLTTNIIGMMAIGWHSHLSKFFNFQNPLQFFVGLLELVSEFARMISFSFRLFGNVFAGEVLLIITAFLIPYVVPLPFLFLEIFVGFIQAFIFAMLTLVFISVATANKAH